MEDSTPKPARLADARLAVLLRKVIRRVPRAAAWHMLVRVAREDHGADADVFLATKLAAELEQRARAQKAVRVVALAKFLAQQDSIPLTLALAAQPVLVARQLALAILAYWPHPLVGALLGPLPQLLPDRQLAIVFKLQILVSVSRSLGPGSQELRGLLRLLIQDRSKNRAVDWLRRLRDLMGPSPAVDELLLEQEDLLRMDCPRCKTQLHQRDMIRHLWEEHQLVLDGRRVREPWSLIEEWIEAYHKLEDPDLLQRCRLLAGRLDTGTGTIRLERRLINAEITPEEAQRNLLTLASQQHASVCPWCHALAPQPTESPPASVVNLQGLLVSDGFLVKVGESGWWNSLTIRMPSGIVHSGPEPGWPFSDRGTRTILALPFVVAALACALCLGQHFHPLLAVSGLLALALGTWYLVGLLWPFCRRPLNERTRIYTWTLLAPEVHRSGFAEQESAFLAGLAAQAETDGMVGLRSKALPPLLHRLEEAVALGSVPGAHLAVMQRLLVADAVAAGADPIPLVVDQIALCFDGKLPLRYAEELLKGWETRWWTVGNLNRFRVLLCDRAYEIGYEVRNLLDVGQTVPSLAEVLRTNQPNDLAALRLLWSQRASVPWERCGSVRTVFDLALYPDSVALLGRFPDLLLFQEEPDWPPVREGNSEDYAPIRILLSSRGIVCQHTLFENLPRQVEMKTHMRNWELTIDTQRFRSRGPLDQLEKRLDRWFRFAFLDFMPRVSQVYGWQSPDRTTLFRAWGAQACGECQRYFIPRIGQLGIAQREDAPVAQVVEGNAIRAGSVGDGR